MLKLFLASIITLSFIVSACAHDKLKAREMEMEKAATDYEAVMVKQTLSAMYENVPINSVTGGGEAEKLFRDLMLTEYSKEIAKSGQIGVAKQLVGTLKSKDSEYQKLLAEVKNAETD